ncbi:inositol monophosphatase [Halobacteriovorax sp.]|uniref:inositol monophosphatase family protein n=1 Tax=Halobacteriovorax sp. TaxID=2020862 RepID=UPI003562E874
MITKELLTKLRNQVLEIVNNRVKSQSLQESLGVSKKSDFSIVTLVDQEISDLVHMSLKHMVKDGYHFFSEEEQVSFGFPSIILDPIDGTRELAQGLGECVVSLALMTTPSSGFAWLFNPFTGFEISSHSKWVEPVIFNTDKLFGYVSKGDLKKGLLNHIDEIDHLEIVAKGSIAFKLGLLASGACDFVYSKTPKNIWDIAAGTLLCWERGFKLYQMGKEVKQLDDIRIDGELIWCRKENFKTLSSSLVK